MTSASLESRVVNEIDSWEINLLINGKPVKYSDKLNCLFYGPGIEVVRKICENYENRNQDFSQMTYGQAKKEFTKQYLLHQLEKYKCNVKKTAQAVGMRWGNLRQHMATAGIKVEEIKRGIKNKEKSNLPDPIIVAEETLTQYEDFFSPLLLKTFLKMKKKTLAENLVNLALDIVKTRTFSEGLYIDINQYSDLPLQLARELFKKDYINLMVRKHNNGRSMANGMGMTHGSLRGLLHNEGIKIKGEKNDSE